MKSAVSDREELLLGSTWDGRSRVLCQLAQLQGDRPEFGPNPTGHDHRLHGWVDSARLMEALERNFPDYAYAHADLYYLLDEHLLERHASAGCIRLSEAGHRMAVGLLESSASASA